MKYELVITEEFYTYLYACCQESLVKPILDVVDIQHIDGTNYWNITPLMRNNKIGIRNIDKVQVISSFLKKGGKVELDSPIYNFNTPYKLWMYMKKHGYLHNNEFYFLRTVYNNEAYHTIADID